MDQVSTWSKRMRRSHVKPFPQPPACKEYCAGEGEDIRPTGQVEGQESDGCIVLRLSEAREGGKTPALRSKSRGMPREHLIQLHVLQSCTTIAPAPHTQVCPQWVASDLSKQSYQTMPCRQHIMNVPNRRRVQPMARLFDRLLF